MTDNDIAQYASKWLAQAAVRLYREKGTYYSFRFDNLLEILKNLSILSLPFGKNQAAIPC